MIVAASLSGGFPDPDATGEEPAGTTLNAVNEYSDFVDQITIDLVPESEGVPYLSLDEINLTVTVSGTSISSNELTANGAVDLNITYNTPSTNTVVGLNILTTVESSNTVGNIYITGNIQNAFPDKFWEYKNFTTGIAVTVPSSADIPDSDVGLYLFKPSLMRYVNIEFNIEAIYDGGIAIESATILKKVVNDWEINRLALLSQVEREENYRSNNYPIVQ